MLHRGGAGGAVGTRPSHWWARSLASATDTGKLDLRKPEHARKLEAALAVIDPAMLNGDK